MFPEQNLHGASEQNAASHEPNSIQHTKIKYDEKLNLEVGSILGEKWLIEKIFGKGNDACFKVRNVDNPDVVLAMKSVPVYDNYSDSSLSLIQGESIFPILFDNKYLNKTYDRIILKDRQILLMEAGPEKTLLNFMDRIRKMPIAKSEQMMREPVWQIVSGLCYMHTNQIVHRDLKPTNILYKHQTQTIKIIDFGSSTLFSVNGRKTHNECWGSTHIMPPEVLLSRCRYNGPEVDVWSIGVILFWSVVGVHPFAKVLHIGYEEIGNDVLVRGAYPKLNAKEIILFDDLIESSRIQLSQKEIDQISPELKDLICAILTPDFETRQRFGITTMEELARHPWFSKSNYSFEKTIQPVLDNDVSAMRLLNKPHFFPSDHKSQRAVIESLANENVYKVAHYLRKKELLDMIYGENGGVESNDDVESRQNDEQVGLNTNEVIESKVEEGIEAGKIEARQDKDDNDDKENSIDKLIPQQAGHTDNNNVSEIEIPVEIEIVIEKESSREKMIREMQEEMEQQQTAHAQLEEYLQHNSKPEETHTQEQQPKHVKTAEEQRQIQHQCHELNTTNVQSVAHIEQNEKEMQDIIRLEAECEMEFEQRQDQTQVKPNATVQQMLPPSQPKQTENVSRDYIIIEIFYEEADHVNVTNEDSNMTVLNNEDPETKPQDKDEIKTNASRKGRRSRFGGWLKKKWVLLKQKVKAFTLRF